jgi:3-methyladenine DNA glycosylase AlkD
MAINKILKEIEKHKDLSKGNFLGRFFKTGPGQYGEGDVFWGLSVPTSRKIALRYQDLSLNDIKKLLEHKVHEVRLIGIIILVCCYKKFDKAGDDIGMKEVVRFYLNNAKRVNNWDLVDTSASNILGSYLYNKKDKSILLKLAKSKNLWEQRIAIIATFYFIKKGEPYWTFKIGELYMNHKHDLIHKATGWMLREVGKNVGEKSLRVFLDKHKHHMPRTMLRYAIEKFSEPIRRKYLL